MRLQTAIQQGLELPMGNNFYNSKGWFLLIKNDLMRMLRIWFGKREIFDSFLNDFGTAFRDDSIQDMKDTIDLMFMSNTWKYDHLWMIYTAEYNPIWNYDGSETKETDRTFTDAHTGQDSTASTGTDTTAYKGTQKDTNSGSIQTARTTYDSSTDYNTNKETDTRSTERTFTNRQDELTHGKTDTTTFGNTHTVGEHITETMQRGGNQGTTTTQEMADQEIRLAGKMNLLHTIALDVVQCLCYS